MTDDTAKRNLAGRAMGQKFLIVCGLALLMSIPALFVFALLMDRTQRAEQTAEEIGGLVGGPQTFMGPVWAVPWRIPAQKPGDTDTTGTVILFPEQARADITTKTEVRQRSLFSVPVYTADLAFMSEFDLSPAIAAAPTGAQLDWSRSELMMGASDVRGARSDVKLELVGNQLKVAPAATLSEVGLLNAPKTGLGEPVRQNKLHLFGAPAVFPAGVLTNPSAYKLVAHGTATFTGARRLGVVAYGRDTTVNIKGDWGSPSFGGGFLPAKRQVDAKSFAATWGVPYIARGVVTAGGPELLGQLGSTEMAVAFTEPANPYQSVARSLKYALLFVGLVFLAYFCFETASGKRLHPAQYVLVGLAQIIFYLLLLSIAERLGFDLGFLIAAGATVLLISVYASWVFGKIWRFAVALVLFSGLYALIYVLMRLEDYALLVGAVASFVAIALVMFFTRRIDWYGGRPAQESDA